MTKIENMEDFKNITSKITSFSHAYLFNVNSLEIAFTYVKEFAKQIILGKEYDKEEFNDICYQIDNNEYDDLYVVNPSTIGINTEEINKLLIYMETKSLRKDGKRVYIIYGFERLTQDVSNKILKFLEEPENDIYALLMTENFEKILPTIVSRCQVLNFSFSNIDESDEYVDIMKKFINDIINRKKEIIAYEYDYFNDFLKDRSLMYEVFSTLEKIISETINYKYNHNFKEKYIFEKLIDYPIISLINVLDITNKMKCLIKSNINLNLLVDRYIIEVTEELSICKK